VEAAGKGGAQIFCEGVREDKDDITAASCAIFAENRVQA
jgi:hypothetical protein